MSQATIRALGLEVVIVRGTPSEDKVLSNKNGLMKIYKRIAEGDEPFGYCFEDDIAISLDNVGLPEIMAHESLGSDIFLIGTCLQYPPEASPFTIGDVCVRHTAPMGFVRCQHGVATSKRGARELYEAGLEDSQRYMDVILEKAIKRRVGVPILRGDFVSSQHHEHYGVIFQNRREHKTTIG